MMRILRSIIAGLFFAAFIIVVISLSISFIYEDEVSEIFLEEVNKRLKSDLQTDEVNLSLLQKFPNATIVLDNARLTNFDTQGDTTLFVGAQSLFLQFDIVDLFRKNYSIDRVHAKNCDVRYYMSEKQNITQSPVKEKGFELDVNELKVRSLSYVIENKNTGFKLKGFNEETILKGNFSSQEFFMDLETESDIKYLQANDFRYISDKTISINSDIKVTPDFYKIRRGLFSLEGIPLSIKGELDRRQNHLNLICTGKNLSISRLKLNIPWKLKKQLKDITISSGRVDLYAKVKGQVKNEQPGIEADLNIRKGKFEFEIKDKIKLSNFNASMYYTNGIFNKPKSSSFTFNNIETHYKNSKIEGNLTIKNFKQPELNTKLNLNFELGDIRKYIEGETIKDVSGNVSSTLTLTAPFTQLNELKNLIKQKKLTGDFTLNNLNFNLGKMKVSDLNGFAYIDNDLFCDNLNFQLNETTDMTFTGKLSNYYTKSDQNLVSIQGKINSETLQLNELITPAKPQNKNFKLPGSVSANLDVLIENLYYKKHHLNELNGGVVLKPDLMKMNKVSFKTLSGNCEIDGYLKNDSETGYYLNSRIFMDGVDINESFKSFNNFGQDYIEAQNIKGSLSGEFYLKAHMDSSLSINPETLYNMSNFTIHRGELIQFKPLLELSRFISVAELKHVRFSKFSNRITIEDEAIQIPKMDINSSAMDLTISGFHTFNGEYRYNMNLLLSEILSRKAKPKVQQYGYIEDDGVGNTRLYLLMKGDTANSTIEYDKQEVKAKIRNDIQKEKNDLKRMFNEEFGLFRKDSLSSPQKDEPARDEFKINWEETNADSLKNKEKPNRKKRKDKKSKFIIEWDKDTISHLHIEDRL
jgi:hypothetical protein